MHEKRTIGESISGIGPAHAEDAIEICTDTSLSLRKEKVKVIRLQVPGSVIGYRVIHQYTCDLSRAISLGVGRRINDLISGALRGYESVADTIAAIVCLHDKVIRSRVIYHVETLLIRPDVDLGNIGQVIQVR